MADRRAAVLGHPIAHSLSPVLHRAAYAALGLAGWRYDAVDVTEADLPGFVAGLDDGWAGLSLTMPLKQAIVPMLDHVEPQAALLGVVNTVLVQGGGARPVLTGANTDVHGILAALGEAGIGGPGRCPVDDGALTGLTGRPAHRGLAGVVVGAGATAASALAALGALGCTAPRVFARSMARAGGTIRAAHRMGVDATFGLFDAARVAGAMAVADVVVCTLPPGAADDLANAISSRGTGVLLDCAYHPRPTALATAWRAAGGTAVTGERMLLHQAGEQVRLMTGSPAPLDAMDDAVRAALAA